MMVRNRVEVPELVRVNRRGKLGKKTTREILEQTMRSEASVLGLGRTEFGELYGLAALATLVDDLIVQEVAASREEGYSWAQIGEATGMSKQAAQQRYARRVLAAGAGNVRAEGGG